MKKQLQFRPAAPDELQVDLDHPRARIPKRLLRLVSEHVQIKSVKYSRSRSGNTHASPKLEQAQLFGIKWWESNRSCHCSHVWELVEFCLSVEKLLLNSALGSDPMRELLSWGRARNGCPYPTLFFEEKKK